MRQHENTPQMPLSNGQSKDTETGRLHPEFKLDLLMPHDFKQEIIRHKESFAPIPHELLLEKLLEQVGPVNFREVAGDIEESEKISRKHYLVSAVEGVLDIARRNNWGMCKNNESVYLYNGAFWKKLETEALQGFLGRAAEKMGVGRFDARHYQFREHLLKQFMSEAHLPTPEPLNGKVLVNLQNGTFEISDAEQMMRQPNLEDFLTYQLPFAYDPDAQAPLFMRYLNTVQPDPSRQMILAEYLGYIFIHSLKLEKTLLLYGSGANGKSVFFEIVLALLGADNVSGFSLQNLTKHDGYQRAELANKLVNYASEINGKLEASIFKQLVSGEPVEARQIYGKPFTMKRYARLIFNCNELPKEVEQTNAFFRRFLIVPFDVTIPEDQQDGELAQKIIQSEMSGVFNWVLEGLKRLLAQRRFTESEAVRQQLEEYRQQSDSVQMFLSDEGYEISTTEYKPLKELFQKYKVYCYECGFYSCSLKTLGDRLRSQGYNTERKNFGQAVFIAKKMFS